MGLPGKDRKDICLLGPASEQLKVEISHRNLVPLPMSPEDAVAHCRRAPKAVVSISNPAELAKHLAAVLRTTLENGAAFLAVNIEKDQFALVRQMCGSEDLSRRLEIPARQAKNDVPLLPVRAFDFAPDWEQRVAQHCAEHDPGRSLGEKCKIESSGIPADSSPGEEDLLLIKRAFNDCTLVRLKYLARGHSRAKGPWVVDAQFKDGRRPVHFVVKTGWIAEIRREIAVMQIGCFNHIPFRHYPPVVVDRSVTGASRQAIVSMLIENAAVLEEYIGKREAAPIIPLIFDGPLRLWRKGLSSGAINIAEFYRERGIVPREPWMLKEIWQQTTQNHAEVLPYGQLYDRFMSHAKIDVQQVDSHGDLHLRNILIHGTGEVLLIDFSDSGPAPASLDPATLDVALAFDIPGHLEAEAEVSDEQRIELYVPPLLDERKLAKQGRRTAAILALRNQIRGSVSELEYQLSTAARLIWWAKYRKSQVAYRCASRIIYGF